MDRVDRPAATRLSFANISSFSTMCNHPMSNVRCHQGLARCRQKHPSNSLRAELLQRPVRQIGLDAWRRVAAAICESTSNASRGSLTTSVHLSNHSLLANGATLISCNIRIGGLHYRQEQAMQHKISPSENWLGICPTGMIGESLARVPQPQHLLGHSSSHCLHTGGRSLQAPTSARQPRVQTRFRLEHTVPNQLHRLLAQ